MKPRIRLHAKYVRGTQRIRFTAEWRTPERWVYESSSCSSIAGAVEAALAFGNVDDDRSVSLAEVGIRKLHDRDDSAIDRETEHRLGQALNVAHDLLGRLGHAGENVDLGNRPALGYNPGRFDPGKSTNLLFEISEIHNSKGSCRGGW